MTAAGVYSYSKCASLGSFLREHPMNFCTTGHVNKLIFSVKASIEAANELSNKCYGQFLVEIVRKQGKIPEEEVSDYVTENFYDSNYCLKFEGVNLMLRSIGVLC